MQSFYLDTEDKTLSFDIIINFKARNSEKVYQDIFAIVQKMFGDYKINITLDIDASD